MTQKAMTNQVSVVIPTYGREQVLLDTIDLLLGLDRSPAAILVVDQTKQHDTETEERLSQLQLSGDINWIKRTPPSITAAMNHGLRAATTKYVLFMDDDIVPRSELIPVHQAAHDQDSTIWATVGQIIQPWQEPTDLPPRVGKLTGLKKDMDFRFNSSGDDDVENTMAGNLCVNRERTLSIGGFDENFLGSAIQFETDFARRIVRAGGRIRFLGNAGLDHLAAGSGGTRAYGKHLTCGNAMHSVGGYYYAFRNAESAEAWKYSVIRCLRQIRTKFHLTHPWWIPVKLLGELRAFLLARKLHRQGPKLCESEAS